MRSSLPAPFLDLTKNAAYEGTSLLRRYQYPQQVHDPLGNPCVPTGVAGKTIFKAGVSATAGRNKRILALPWRDFPTNKLLRISAHIKPAPMYIHRITDDLYARFFYPLYFGGLYPVFYQQTSIMGFYPAPGESGQHGWDDDFGGARVIIDPILGAPIPPRTIINTYRPLKIHQSVPDGPIELGVGYYTAYTCGIAGARIFGAEEHAKPFGGRNPVVFLDTIADPPSERRLLGDGYWGGGGRTLATFGVSLYNYSMPIPAIATLDFRMPSTPKTLFVGSGGGEIANRNVFCDTMGSQLIDYDFRSLQPIEWTEFRREYIWNAILYGIPAPYYYTIGLDYEVTYRYEFVDP